MAISICTELEFDSLILPAANLRLENPRLLQPLQPDQNYCIIKMTKFSKKNFKKFEICKKLLNCFTA